MTPHRCFSSLARASYLWVAVTLCPTTSAAELPNGFVDELLFQVGESPATLKFSPAGDLYYGLRIQGTLYRVPYGQWTSHRLLYTFDIPKDAGGSPDEHRSSGLRDITFSADGRYLFAFYMHDSPRHNRVVRLEIDAGDPDKIVPGSETLLFSMPFNGSASSGSHNGGAIEFGQDGMLYFTTGDGWNGGDPVQSLFTHTGKVFRIAADGQIPTDNPFYGQAGGQLRAVYALGCRNPFAMSYRASDGALFINETTGFKKSDVFAVAPGANFGHQGFGGIGIDTSEWANASVGGHLNTGGAWYDDWRFTAPPPKTWPAQYHFGFFVCQWGTNSGAAGQITYFPPGSSSATAFASEISTSGGGGTLKPTCLRMGPDGDLYYLLTTYQTSSGQVQRIRYTGVPGVETPIVQPNGGTFPAPISVALSSGTPNANIHYTLDGTDPDAGDTLYQAPVMVAATLTLKARAFLSPLVPSGIATADFTIGAPPNQPPVAIGGPANIVWPIDRLVTLNGSASFDPDGADELLSDSWTQTSGPPLVGFDGGDFVSFFDAPQVGEYGFRLDVVDPSGDSDADELTISVAPCLNDVLDELGSRWLFDEEGGELAYDSSSGALHATLIGGPTWSTETAYPASSRSVRLDGIDDAISISSELDPSGGELTLSAWIRADDFDVHDARIVSKTTGQAEDDHLFMLSTIQSGGSTRLRFRLKTDGMTSTLIATGGDLTPGVWTHVAASYDGTTMRLYKDAALIGAMPKSGLITSAPNVAVAIGNQPATASGGSRPFDGLIDDVRIYQRALEPAELALLADPDEVMQFPCSCETDIGFGGGISTLTLCGDLGSGGSSALRAVGLPPAATSVLVFSAQSQPTPVYGGVLAAHPVWFVFPFTANAAGHFEVEIPGGSGPLTFFVQAASPGPTPQSPPYFSNALMASLLP